MEAEASVVKGFLCDHDPNLCRSSNSLHKAYQLVLEVPESFPATIKCYQIAVTIAVSSATAEGSFSSLRRIKTYLRSTMSQTRLSNLALLYIERHLSSNLWNQIDNLVIKFAETHNNSRIALF
uniref:HAT C-terminal dimerisation domain-containing protein n=1 Tax=Amphimedon queenslandica TaxID=400682 RepID=A0A1X7SK88_AMPQE